MLTAQRTQHTAPGPQTLTEAVFEAVLLQLFPSVLYEGRGTTADRVRLGNVPVSGHDTALSEGGGEGRVRSRQVSCSVSSSG